MSAITAKASRKMKKYAVLTREPRCFLGSFDFSWEQRKVSELFRVTRGYVLAATQTETTKTDEKPYPVYSSQTKDKGLMGYYKDYLYEDAITWTTDGANAGTVNYRAGKFYCTNVCGVLLSNEVKANQMIAEALNSVAKGYVSYVGNPKLMNNVMADIVIQIPTQAEEREQLSSFFAKLDNLITLHQRKCVFLFGFFQAFISMIFTASTFSWEQRKLSEITDKVTEKNAGLQYVETFTNSAEFGIISQRDFFDHDIAKLGSLDGYYIVKNEDFVYNPRISTSAPVGPINRNKLGRTGVMSPLYTVFRPHDIDTTYLEYFFKCGYWHSFMNFNGDSGAKSDRFSIRDNVFFQMPIPIPDIDEQRKIGELLTCLDNLITLHQRECISFTARAGRLILTANKKRNTSSWEQRKFEEIAVRSSVICSDDTLPRVEYEDIVSGTGRLNKDIYAKQSIKSGIAFHQGDVLYGKLRPYLQNWLLPTFDGLAVGDFWVLQPQNADSSFLYRLIQSRQFDEVANQSTGTKMPRADWKLVSKTVFSIPSNISEQAAIGTYFTALDSLITLHQRKPFIMKWRTSDANRNQTNRLVL